ncbi:MAG TPA: N-acylglucosamine 2-epimerase [Planctomycetes bacterium]|nr:N-acylglucosamine 2-epimerase [Planctomycetota bacterium]HIN79869.1 N-acylglucosamine 2-epimerase [Planctomycetota bacterium]HIO65428.1 N-acylglucosamine 2-epimerase [Planctomycetota bacterium]
MKPDRIVALIALHRDTLLDDVLPFWLRHSPDSEFGGYLHHLDRDGRVVDDDKGIWCHGRFAWLLGRLCRTVEDRPEWRTAHQSGIDFLRAHAYGDDGHLLFQVTRDGQPLRRRRYLFSETFASIAFAEHAALTSDEAAAQEARRLYRSFVDGHEQPGQMAPKVDPVTRPMRSIGYPLGRIATAQALGSALGDDLDADIDSAIDEIATLFLSREHGALLEVVSPDGTPIDHVDGRTLNPGHAIEVAWFILAEAHRRGGKPEWVALGCEILDGMWQRGWDEEFGGLLYFVDLDGGPVQEYWHEMKFWWPHCEAALATLYAHALTGEARYERMHRKVIDWSFEHFADPEMGEWFGYLRRDGSVASTWKGNLWKGPFHLPRMLLVSWRLLEEMATAGGDLSDQKQ